MNHEILDTSDLDFTKTNEQREKEELTQIFEHWCAIFGKDNEIVQGLVFKKNLDRTDMIGYAIRFRNFSIREISNNGNKKLILIDNLLILNNIFSYFGLKKIYLSQIGDKVHDIIKK